MPGDRLTRTSGRALRLAGATLGLAGLGACASAPGDMAANPADPLENFNRAVFGFNQAVDEVVLRPTAVVYDTVVPPQLQYNIRSFLRNLESPLIIANNLLQGDTEGAGLAFERFFVNTIVGIGGIVDVAAEIRPELAYETEDFGQTLAVWGVDAGPYLVLPLLGPSNPRDAVGRGVDALADPVGWALRAEGLTELQIARFLVGVVDARAQSLDTTDELEATSLDYYATVRSLYQQYREGLINEDGAATLDIPDFDDPEDGPPAPAAPPANALPDMPDADAPADEVTLWMTSATPAPELVAEQPDAAPAVSAFTMAPVTAVRIDGPASAAIGPVWEPTLFPDQH